MFKMITHTLFFGEKLKFGTVVVFLRSSQYSTTITRIEPFLYRGKSHIIPAPDAFIEV